ncbi:MAG: hypothetical protein J0I84_10625 [Terrimonas sp.]|nr:hypothetical protein [Terrimonas sp.]
MTACKHQIDESSIELREHKLSYIKGTNTLVEGEVVRKVDGEMVELRNYKDGKMIGDFFQYGRLRQVLSHGFGIELKDYEKTLNGVDLTNCILSIVQIKNDFSYATLYMDNMNLFSDKEKLLQLSKSILTDYGEKYKLDRLLIFDDKHEYSIYGSAIANPNYTIDTVLNTKTIRLNFR